MRVDNKTIVETGLIELFSRGDVDAVLPLLRPDFVDHGPGLVAGNRDDWAAAARQLPLREMKLELDQLLSDGDRVVTLSRRWLPWQQLWIAAADIWRVTDGRIAEHAEVFQPLPNATEPSAGDLVPW